MMGGTLSEGAEGTGNSKKTQELEIQSFSDQEIDRSKTDKVTLSISLIEEAAVTPKTQR